MSKHQDYLSQNATSEDIFTSPQFKFDTRGRAVLTMPGQDTLALSVTPGSKIISHAATTYTNKPATDPASLRTGSLHASTVITVGNSIYLDAPNSRIVVGEDGSTQWIMDKRYLRGIDAGQTVFGFFLTDVSLGENKEFSKGDVLIGNYPESYLRYDCSNRRLIIVGDVAMAGDVVSINFTTGVSGYKLEYATGNAEFSNVVVRGTSTIGGTLASAIGTAIDDSAHLVTDIINERLDSSAKNILSDFTFGTTDYAGALKSGTITWNSTTGAVTGGSGVLVFRGGIIAANSGVATITLDAATGAATFAGALSAPTGNIGAWTIGAAQLSSGKLKLQSTAEVILVGDATAPLTGAGIYIGKSGSDYVFRAGDPSGDYMYWNASTLCIKGSITMTSGSIPWGSVTKPSYVYSEVSSGGPPSDADNTIDSIGGTYLTYIDATGIYSGTITGNLIQTSSSAKTGIKMSTSIGGMEVYGEMVKFYSTDGTQYGKIGDDGSAYLALSSISGRNIKIDPSGGSVYFDLDSGDGIAPISSGVGSCGLSSQYWEDVFTNNLTLSSGKYLHYTSSCITAEGTFTSTKLKLPVGTNLY